MVAALRWIGWRPKEKSRRVSSGFSWPRGRASSTCRPPRPRCGVMETGGLATRISHRQSRAPPKTVTCQTQLHVAQSDLLAIAVQIASGVHVARLLQKAASRFQWQIHASAFLNGWTSGTPSLQIRQIAEWVAIISSGRYCDPPAPTFHLRDPHLNPALDQKTWTRSGVLRRRQRAPPLPSATEAGPVARIELSVILWSRCCWRRAGCPPKKFRPLRHRGVPNAQRLLGTTIKAASHPGPDRRHEQTKHAFRDPSLSRNRTPR